MRIAVTLTSLILATVIASLVWSVLASAVSDLPL